MTLRYLTKHPSGYKLVSLFLTIALFGGGSYNTHDWDNGHHHRAIYRKFSYTCNRLHSGSEAYASSVRLYCPDEIMELALIITSVLALIVTVVSLVVCCRGDEEAHERIKVVDAVAHFALAVVLLITSFLYVISATLLVVNCNTQSHTFVRHALEMMGIGANPPNRRFPTRVNRSDPLKPIFPETLELNTTETYADRTICVFLWQLSDKYIISFNGMLCAIYYGEIAWVLWRSRDPNMKIVKGQDPPKEETEEKQDEDAIMSAPQSDTNATPDN